MNEKGEKDIIIRKILPICIAFDHRALDFGETVPFQQRLNDIFAHPEEINTWISTKHREEYIAQKKRELAGE